MLHANSATLRSRAGVIAAGIFTLRFAGVGIFDLFCSCDLDLDPMTLIHELDPYPLEIPDERK